MLPLEDHQLLSAIQTGSEKAFDMLFRKYYPALCAYSHKMVSLEEGYSVNVLKIYDGI